MDNKLHFRHVKMSVDSLFSLPVKNHEDPNEEYLPTIFVDNNNNTHRLVKVNDNDPKRVMEAVRYAYNTWQEKNKLLLCDDWFKQMNDMLTAYKTFTNDKSVHRRINIYIRVMEKLIVQIKEHQNQPELNDNILDGIEIKKGIEQIALLNDLGILEFLRDKYPELKQPSYLSELISVILIGKERTIRNNISALYSDEGALNKNYPKSTPKSLRIKALIESKVRE